MIVRKPLRELENRRFIYQALGRQTIWSEQRDRHKETKEGKIGE